MKQFAHGCHLLWIVDMYMNVNIPLTISDPILVMRENNGTHDSEESQGCLPG